MPSPATANVSAFDTAVLPDVREVAGGVSAANPGADPCTVTDPLAEAVICGPGAVVAVAVTVFVKLAPTPPTEQV